MQSTHWRAGSLSFRIAALVLAAMALWCPGPPAHGRALEINRSLCHAVTPASAQEPPPASAFRCTGEPDAAYGEGKLWLRADMAMLGLAPPLTLLVHQSRFDRLDVRFDYADGHVERDRVESGNYADHWRVGAMIAFDTPERPARLTSVTMGFEGLASHRFARARLLPMGVARVELSLAAALIGGALMLLAGGAIYNLLLAMAVRRVSIAWHGGWALSVFIWGVVWSQIELVFFPSLAGRFAAHAATFFSMTSMACATLSAATSIEPGLVSRRARWSIVALAAGIFLFAIPASLVRSNVIEIIGSIIGILTLFTLAAVIAYIALAWRRGSVAARDFAAAWGIPMGVLAFVYIFDVGTGIFGGGSQIIVLLACSIQTILLSILLTKQALSLRIERDAAQAAQAELNELAIRDSLTGLLNRRGFIAHLNKQLREAELKGRTAALLVIDVDHFKSINDRFGHDAGDAVLRGLAEALRRCERPDCLAGRLGGEEFVLMVTGIGTDALMAYANQLRAQIAALDHGSTLPEGQRVTVSIGIAPHVRGLRFTGLFKIADEALYKAKNGGRNCVVMAATDTVDRADANAEMRRLSAITD